MPRAKKLDDSLILSAFDRLQNGKAVARELGIHEQSIYQSLRRSRGVCLRCGGPIVAGRKSCDACLKFDRTRIKAARKIKIRLGICQQCDEQRSAISRLYCEAHRIAAAERNAVHDEKKRGSPNAGISNERQKLRSLNERYGAAGIACWNEAGGKCEVCARPYGEVAIHIHHVDEDRENNTRENFVCLCFYCHNATHLLINSSNRVALIEWFSRTYPDRPLR